MEKEFVVSMIGYKFKVEHRLDGKGPDGRKQYTVKVYDKLFSCPPVWVAEEYSSSPLKGRGVPPFFEKDILSFMLKELKNGELSKFTAVGKEWVKSRFFQRNRREELSSLLSE